MFVAFVLVMDLIAAVILLGKGNPGGFDELSNLLLGTVLVLSCVLILWTREDVDELLP